MPYSKKEIVYPFLLECCHYSVDNFWETVFEDLAYGVSPHGTYINKDFLCCNYKKKEFCYKLERKDAKLLHDDIYNLLSDKLGMLSQYEKINRKHAFQTVEDNIRESRVEWSNIRKKNVKNMLIEQYVIRMMRAHNLTAREARYLLSTITLATVFKVITSKDIEYDNKEIKSINCIHFEDGKVILDKSLYSLDVSFAPQIVIEKKIATDMWEKFLNDLRKLSNFYNDK